MVAGRPVSVGDALNAWVDLFTEPASLGSATTGAGTAGDLTRAILQLEASEAVAQGEVGTRSPRSRTSSVAHQGAAARARRAHAGPGHPAVAVDRGAVPLQEVGLPWRGRPLVVCLWAIWALVLADVMAPRTCETSPVTKMTESTR